MKIALVSVKKKPLDYENDDTAYADFINFVSSDVELFDSIPHPIEILKEPPSNPLTLTKHELHSILNNFLHIRHLSKVIKITLPKELAQTTTTEPFDLNFTLFVDLPPLSEPIPFVEPPDFEFVENFETRDTGEELDTHCKS